MFGSLEIFIKETHDLDSLNGQCINFNGEALSSITSMLDLKEFPINIPGYDSKKEIILKAKPLFDSCDNILEVINKYEKDVHSLEEKRLKVMELLNKKPYSPWYSDFLRHFCWLTNGIVNDDNGDPLKKLKIAEYKENIAKLKKTFGDTTK